MAPDRNSISADSGRETGGALRDRGVNGGEAAVVDAAVIDGSDAARAGRRIVLFDGSNADAWASAAGGAVSWPVTMGYIEVAPGSGHVHTKQSFLSFVLHAEFWVPTSPPTATEAERGNSGIYLQGRYEIQVLDSYGYPLSGHNDCAAIYGLKDADSNESTPPETWQSYDISFAAASYTGSTKTAHARVSVIWNGKEVQHDVDLPASTAEGAPESPAPGPILLQDHGYKVRYRNMWLEELP